MSLAASSAPVSDLDQWSVLHHLVVKGFGSPQALVLASGAQLGAVDRCLAALAGAGWARHREGVGAGSGWLPTPAGRGRHLELLGGPLAPADPEALAGWYHDFGPLNAELKQLCTDWQLRRRPDGRLVPNDHRARAYDAALRRRLVDLDARVGAACARIGAAFPRIARYRDRLAAARAAFVAGDGDRLAKPGSESYHDIWMELHQDLLLTLGLARTAADA